MNDDPYVDRFYKKVINGKKGNLFNRMDAVEELLRNLRVQDVGEYITIISQNNNDMVIPSVPVAA